MAWSQRSPGSWVKLSECSGSLPRAGQQAGQPPACRPEIRSAHGFSQISYYNTSPLAVATRSWDGLRVVVVEEAMCDRVYSTTKPWSCAWGDATDGLGAAPMRWADNNEGGDDDSPMGVSFNLEHKINACGCQFWDALSCQIAHRCGGTLAEGQKVWLADGSSWNWRDVEPGTQLLGGARARRWPEEADMRPTPCLDVCASSSAVATMTPSA